METSRDEYYHDRNSRLNTIIGDQSEVWTKIIAARDDYKRQHGNNYTNEYFNLWLMTTWGIELKFQDGMVSLAAKIVDEQKYTLFLLRY